MDELNTALHKFNQNIVDASRQVCRDSIAFCMTQVVLPLLEKVGEIDVRFKCASPLPNEAYFQGMKTTCVNEFELTVILTHLVTAKTFEDTGCQDTNFSCYGRVLPHQAPHPLGDLLVDAGPSQGHLSAQRIRQIFAQLVRQAASILPLTGLTLEVFFKEPYAVVKIFRGPDMFLFELVPAFIFPGEWPSSAASWPEDHSDWLTEAEVKIAKEMGFYAQALPCPADPADQSLFRISFNMAEKYLLRHVVPENSNLSSTRKDCERILRLIRESDKDDFQPVSSYHIKTVLLHECARWPDLKSWSSEKLAERFLELLRDLILVLDSHELPHFFIRDCNLLRQFAPEQLTATAVRLREIYQDIFASPANSIRLQC
ncbi:protein mab-21-like 2 [Aplysia californica]|uniref:Protein mab-21-like 2 n=1 Tax=Aplysia californica TaxID=6500 RepID=A0ABM0JKP7_APLCA|nr:protein mab-21-like 2 [Aplysia californica]